MTVEERLARLEDLEAIRFLKWQYCYYSDQGWPGAGADHERWIQLFTHDAVWDTGGITAPLNSRDELRQWHRQIARSGSMSIHIVGNAGIELGGDEATGFWHALTPLTDPAQAVASWSCGLFEDGFRRTAAGWRICRVSYRPAFYTPFQGAGWIRS